MLALADGQATIARSHCPQADASAARANHTPRMSNGARIGTIGIIGACHSGQAFARLAQRAGRKVVIADNRGPELFADHVNAVNGG